MPPVRLVATDGRQVALDELAGICVVYVYPRTSPPDAPPIEGWDLIPGARGCTPQSCGFRDYFAELKGAGVAHVFGLSAQESDYQGEAADRLELPFPLLSDPDFEFAQALGLETFDAKGMTLHKRSTLILRDGEMLNHMVQVSEPALNASDVIAWLNRHAN